MASILFDSFDHYDISAASVPNGKWDSINSVEWSSSGGRRSGGAAYLNNDADYLVKDVSNKQTLFCGFAAKHVGDISNDQDFLRFYESGTIQIKLRHTSYNGTSYIAAYRNGTLLGTTDTRVVGADTWYYYEVKVVIDNSAGSVVVKIDNDIVLNLTNIDTQETSNAYIDQFNLRGQDSDVYYDDFYLIDDSGSTNNTFLGDIKIDPIYPDADGTYTHFSPSTGSDHYALVDEAEANTSDYNDGDAVDEMDSYGITAPEDLGAILAIQVTSYVSNPDVGTRKFKHFIRSNSSDYLGSTENTLSNTWKIFSEIWETDPDDSASWTKTKLDNAEFGVKVTV